MKRLAFFSICLLVSGAVTAQTTEKKINNKSAIAGNIHDLQRQPVTGIQAFIYKSDTIMASGYSDATGYFETNSTFPGVYNLKLVYPSEKAIIVTGVPIKMRQLTMVNLKTNAPSADTTIAYVTLMPPPPDKKKK